MGTAVRSGLPWGHETQNGLGESKGAEHFCLSGGSSVLSSRLSPTECKAFSALICPVRMTGLSKTSPWLARRDIQGLVHWGTTLPFTNLPPGLSSHVLSFPIMTASGLPSCAMLSRPFAHTEWNSGYNWFKFAKKIFVHYKKQLWFRWKKGQIQSLMIFSFPRIVKTFYLLFKNALIFLGNRRSKSLSPGSWCLNETSSLYKVDFCFLRMKDVTSRWKLRVLLGDAKFILQTVKSVFSALLMYIPAFLLIQHDKKDLERNEQFWYMQEYRNTVFGTHCWASTDWILGMRWWKSNPGGTGTADLVA